MKPLFGGALIGVALTLMLFINGKVMGVGGIIGESLEARSNGEWFWRLTFITGLVSGGVLVNHLKPIYFSILTANNIYDFMVSGFLVGLGALMANDCNSRQGMSGVSRFSIRSVIAVLVFLISGLFSTMVYRFFKGAV